MSATAPHGRVTAAARARDAGDQLRDTLAHVWGYREFRPLQREAMEAVLAGRDGLVVFPTGGGKSLCFQLPAVVAGPALVVSPLIALMRDQVEALKALGIEAAYLNSTVDRDEAEAVAGRWRRGDIKLLYAAPERILLPGFLRMLEGRPPAFVAVDEAHCISQWGHDFRPEYRNLAELRRRFPDVPIHGYTATATERVRGDIAEALGLRDPERFVGDFDRPNLHYRVERRERGTERVIEIAEGHKGQAGIVYCISRKDVERVAEGLKGAGIKAAPYHAGLDSETRRRTQDAFAREKLDVVVATVAFGMGIDRGDVRFVVHAAMPKSVESYQQEAGRAGRDGLPAECVLLFSPADTQKWRMLMERAEGVTDDGLTAQIAKLDEMARFAGMPACRHRFLVEYFGQAWEKGGDCGNCDACLNPPAWHPDGHMTARKILSGVARLANDWPRGLVYNAQVLRGDETADLRTEHRDLSTYGLLSESTEADIRRWIEECASSGWLCRDAEYGTLRLTAAGREVMADRAKARLTAPTPAEARRPGRKDRIRASGQAAAIVAADDPATAGLMERLRDTRRRIAEETGLKPYMIFHDTTLKALAETRPTTPDALLGVPGFGDAKVSRFGDAVTAAIAEYCTEAGLPTDIS